MVRMKTCCISLFTDTTGIVIYAIVVCLTLLAGYGLWQMMQSMFLKS